MFEKLRAKILKWWRNFKQAGYRVTFFLAVLFFEGLPYLVVFLILVLVALLTGWLR